MLSPQPRRMHHRARLIGLAALTLLALAAVIATHPASGAPKQPNVIVILMDDEATSDMSVMSNVQSEIAAQGVSFNEAYSSFPLCCPSRATLLSGQYAHNHGVLGNLPPNGSWTRFQPHESNDLPVWLQGSGYYNVHIGKYLNGYANNATDLYVPPGWDQWYGKVSEDALYYDYSLIEKTGPTATPHVTFYGNQPADYQTDVFANRAVNFLNDTGSTHQPFFLNLWFNSPHYPFDPAPRDLGRLDGMALPALPAYNEKNITDKPKWFQHEFRRRLTRRQTRQIADQRRLKEEQLLSADEAIGRLIQTLKDKGILNNTYIIFTSDQGFFRGEHRIIAGKYLPYDPSSRVPLLIRGPGIPQGQTSNELVWFGDITQAILQLATGSQNPALDGRSLLPFAENPSLRTTRPVLLEAYTGAGAQEASVNEGGARSAAAKVGIAGRKGITGLDDDPQAVKSQEDANHSPAYKSIRTARYEYTIYANGQSELYDMQRDPAQMNSVVNNPRYRLVKRWLMSNLIPLSTCAGATCRVEIGPDPAPLSKKALKHKGKKGNKGPKKP
jgi:N-acetylglucosamine-6-sulfatase